MMIGVVPALRIERHTSTPALPPDPPAVVLGDVPDDREPEPGPPRRARPGPVDAVEALEDPGQLAGRDADALIGDGDPDPVAVPDDRHADDSRLRVADGVVH